jgi:hypothetical protein
LLLVAFGFLRVGEEGVDGLVVVDFERVESFVRGGVGFVEGVVLVSLSSNSCFWFTSWVIMYFIYFSSDWCCLTS